MSQQEDYRAVADELCDAYAQLMDVQRALLVATKRVNIAVAKASSLISILSAEPTP